MTVIVPDIAKAVIVIVNDGAVGVIFILAIVVFVGYVWEFTMRLGTQSAF